VIWEADADGIARAAARLVDGGLVGVPTETVYGLAADAARGDAVAAVYDLKGRPQFNPLIVHVADLDMAEAIVHFDETDSHARRLAQQFWPGPLTLVLPMRADAAIAGLATAGLPTVAIRIPSHPVARRLLSVFGRPFVAPSANRSGRLSPTRAEHVVADFGNIVPVLDGGPSADGVESTILRVVGDEVVMLRPGALTPSRIEEVIGQPLSLYGGSVLAPGMLLKHYAPGVALRIGIDSPHPEENYLGFGGSAGAALDLSPSGDLREAAANLFDYLRRLDREKRPIAIAPIPEEGLGIAINDRLRRAAAGSGAGTERPS
jgi:L-threonylcarbamoyladenylate synthase